MGSMSPAEKAEYKRSTGEDIDAPAPVKSVPTAPNSARPGVAEIKPQTPAQAKQLADMLRKQDALKRKLQAGQVQP